MSGDYGKLVRAARTSQNPYLSAKDLANALSVTPPFITDIEKGRRLPSLEKQKIIKELLSSPEYPSELFDDLAASDNEDSRIVAEDLADIIRRTPALRDFIRIIESQNLSEEQIQSLIDRQECASNEKPVTDK